MNEMMTIQQMKEVIAEGRLSDAMNNIGKLVGVEHFLYNEFIVIQMNLNILESQNRLGSLTGKEFNTTKSNIAYNTLSFLDKLSEQLTEEQRINSTLHNHKEQFYTLLFLLEESISLTSSVISSEQGMTVIEHDRKYEDERKTLVKLKALAMAYFSDLCDYVDTIGALHNNYWGYQRILVKAGKTSERGYVGLQKEIIKTEKEVRKEVQRINELLSTYD